MVPPIIDEALMTIYYHSLENPVKPFYKLFSFVHFTVAKNVAKVWRNTLFGMHRMHTLNVKREPIKSV